MVDDCKFCGKFYERNRKKCFVFGKVCKKCKKENYVISKCYFYEKKISLKKKKLKVSKLSLKEIFRKKVFFVEIDFLLEEEILFVEFFIEDDNVSIFEVINFVIDFFNKVYVVMEI